MGDASDSADTQSGDARRFAAFISYSHADADAAAKLQRKLERYRLPKRIAETRAAKSTALGRIFRDREDFAAASSLSAAIREAILQAEAMVVMCSPDAAVSPWVAAEIELFQQLHPGRPILAALLSGEPAASFPSALTANGNEPLAADLRPEGDGEQLAFLKIVAGIAGVPLDELIQRDAQRRIRSVTAITVGALAAMLIMSIMTAYAIQARNEAARQRAAAEGLVEYMLTDLRANLEGVGSFKVMDAVNARAMEHYRLQGNLADLPADSLERRARVLHVMGEDLEKRDQLDLALAKFSDAYKVTQTLLLRQPNHPDRIFAHAQSNYWVGRIAERKSDWPKAQSYYRAYHEAGKRLTTINPGNPDYMMEMGWGFLNLGIVELQARKRPDFGEKSFLSAIKWMTKASDARNKDMASASELGNAFAWLADSYYLRKDYSRSLAARHLELATKEQIAAANADSNSARFDVAKAQYAVAANLLQLKQKDNAEILLQSSHGQLRKLVQLEPLNREWRAVNAEVEKLLN